jgi:glycosyltransferase involved in cell wall biosynthesis
MQEPPRGITINGRFMAQPMTGAQRFATETVMAIDRLLDTPQYESLRGRVKLLTPLGVTRSLPLNNIAMVRKGRLSGYAWDQLQLPFFTTGQMLLSLAPMGPLIFGRQYVVVYDATFKAVPQGLSWKVKAVYDAIVPSLARRASGVAAISQFTRSEMQKWFGIEPARVALCYCGSDHVDRVASDAAVLDRNNLRGQRYMLVVGLGGKNKNLDMLLWAFAAAKQEGLLLCIAGKRNPRIHGDVVAGKGNAVRLLGGVSDGELKALYENATALIYPSTYEGFGLPPVEAMRCGCPVIASDQAAVVEVSGGSALHFPLAQPEQLTELIRRVATDDALRAEMSAKGRARAKEFEWERTARVLLDGCVAVP